MKGSTVSVFPFIFIRTMEVTENIFKQRSRFHLYDLSRKDLKDFVYPKV